VYHKIFTTYCRPGGVLRTFTVAQITAKAAWVRSAYIKGQQQRVLQEEEWIKQIPVLP
jgi:hypothetical protein